MKIGKIDSSLKKDYFAVYDNEGDHIFTGTEKQLIELAELIFSTFKPYPNLTEQLLKLQRENDRLEKELKNSQNLFAKRKCESTEGYEQKYKSEKEYSKRLEKLLFNSIKNY